MADLSAKRVHPLASSPRTQGAIGGVALSTGPNATRFVLRGVEAIGPAGAALGLALPTTPSRAATAGDHAALWLGPDEWLLILPEGFDVALLTTALSGVACSLVDVSHRQLGLVLDGPGAALALNAAVPLDLSEEAFPVGMCTRTIFEKAEIVLWRTGPERFHLEVWRSFSPYVWDLLEIFRKENAA